MAAVSGTALGCGSAPPASGAAGPRLFVYFGLDRSRIAEPAFLESDAIAGAQLKYRWPELEAERDRYDLAPILRDLAFLEQHDKALFIQVQDVSFEEGIVNVPAYFRTDPAFGGGVARQYSFDDETTPVPEGWVARRWDPTVRERFGKLLAVLGRELDGRIEGVTLPETAIDVGARAPLHPSGFTPEVYAESVKAILSAAKNAFPRSHVILYANFMPGEALPDDDHGYLRGVYRHADNIGTGISGPDLLPYRPGQRSHSYPLIAARRPGAVTGVAVQWGNLEDRHPVTGRDITVKEVYEFARDSLRLDYIFWGLQEPYDARDVLPFLDGLVSQARWGGSVVQTRALRVTAVGRFDFEGGDSPDPRKVADGLSGIARLRGNRYVAVSDAHAQLHFLTIEVDAVTGAILHAELGTPLPLTDTLGLPFPDATQGRDREAVVYDAATGTVWISNEQAGADRTISSLAQHSLATGRMLRLVAASCESPLAVFCRMRDNNGFESLARNADGTDIWTANEQSLTVDGGLPTTSDGSVVRLQRLDRQSRPVVQYAYVVAPLSPTTPLPALVSRISGLVELLALPNGTLLSLERAVTGDSTRALVLRIRIYQLDVEGATDISQEPWAHGLLQTDRPYVPVSKRLLIELAGSTGREANFNFEGLALGPRLQNGDYSLILVSDNGSGTAQSLYALRLSGLDSAP